MTEVTVPKKNSEPEPGPLKIVRFCNMRAICGIITISWKVLQYSAIKVSTHEIFYL